jgi:succinylglutamate desuccinylase
VFNTAQSITKLSDAFRMAFGRETENFTRSKKGEVIATDGETVYTVSTTRNSSCSRIRMCGLACAPGSWWCV